MRKLLMVVLAFGASAGFLSGFAHMAAHHHRAHGGHGCDRAAQHSAPWQAPAEMP